MWKLTPLLGAIALAISLTPVRAAELEVPGIYDQSVGGNRRARAGRYSPKQQQLGLRALPIGSHSKYT